MARMTVVHGRTEFKRVPLGFAMKAQLTTELVLDEKDWGMSGTFEHQCASDTTSCGE